MFAAWKVKRAAGKWKRSCRPSGATTALQCWGALSSPRGAVHQGTTAETLPVTCCLDTTPAIISGPGYGAEGRVMFVGTQFRFKTRIRVTEFLSFEIINHIVALSRVLQ